jgi:hypothetical protein
VWCVLANCGYSPPQLLAAFRVRTPPRLPSCKSLARRFSGNVGLPPPNAIAQEFSDLSSTGLPARSDLGGFLASSSPFARHTRSQRNEGVSENDIQVSRLQTFTKLVVVGAKVEKVGCQAHPLRHIPDADSDKGGRSEGQRGCARGHPARPFRCCSCQPSSRSKSHRLAVVCRSRLDLDQETPCYFAR